MSLIVTSLAATACFVDNAGNTTAETAADTGDGGTAPTTGDAGGCGDGVLDPGEQCDNGPGNADAAACKTDCTPQSCGDGELGPGEGCDDGNQSDGDGCSSQCVPKTCGNGQLDDGEACDDGNQVDSDTCTHACTVPTCGDGLQQVGEQCDDGANNGPGKPCSADCRLGLCGDASVDAGEQCDDGNVSDGDGCSAQCTLEDCGDGELQDGEQCDDGNDVDDDACSNACAQPTCGDSILQASEQCDDGNEDTTDACVLCKQAVCGDGFLFMNFESCDDGNANDEDACNNSCTSAGKRVFVTSVAYSGDLGGVVGADSKCAAQAQQAGLAGVYMAWISASINVTSPSVRFLTQADAPYRKLDGTQVANDWDDLIDGDIDSPIDIFENGLPAGGEPEVWSNVTFAGAADLDNKSTCMDWQSAGDETGPVGVWQTDEVHWTDSGQTRTCADNKRLYCFEQ